MRVAVTYDNGEVYQHFGHTEQFKIYDVQDGTVTERGILSAGSSGHEALADLLQKEGIEALICGGIGGGAQMALASLGIALYAGISGSADRAVQALADGTLKYTSEANCSHHHEGGDHSCGDHHCGH